MVCVAAIPSSIHSAHRRCRAALILGIQYLTFQAFPIIFEDGHGFNVQSTGLSFIGMGVGLFIGLACQPFVNRYGMSVLQTIFVF